MWDIRRVTWIKTRKKGVESGRFDVLKSDRLGLINKCTEAGTGDFGVPTTHETPPCFSTGAARVKTATRTS